MKPDPVELLAQLLNSAAALGSLEVLFELVHVNRDVVIEQVHHFFFGQSAVGEIPADADRDLADSVHIGLEPQSFVANQVGAQPLPLFFSHREAYR
jgi:hypothetical protein